MTARSNKERINGIEDRKKTVKVVIGMKSARVSRR